MRLIQSARRRGRDAGEGFGAVRGQVEGGFPGSAVVQGALYDEVAGTRTLPRLQAELQQPSQACEQQDEDLDRHLKGERQVVKVEQVVQVQLHRYGTHICNRHK